MAFDLWHPKIVHFPVALFIMAAGVDCAGLIIKKEQFAHAARMMFFLAACSLPFAIASGLWEAQRLHLNHPVLTTHRNAGFALAVVSWVYLFLRRWVSIQQNRFLFTSMVCLCALLAVIAGHWGGILVYNYSVGIK